jgi:hypothetical protein
MSATGCGGSSGVAVTSGADAGADASSTDDALAPDAAAGRDGASTDATSEADTSVLPGGPWKRVFFTHQVFKISAFGGLSGADALCQAAADGSGLSGQFRAWLSTEVEAASAHLAHSTSPYATLSNVVVAANWTELTSGKLRHAIDETEQGAVPQTGTACGLGAVWTGSLKNGDTATGGTCAGWTDPNGDATLGFSIGNDETWTNACAGVCAGTASLYCIEQ